MKRSKRYQKLKDQLKKPEGRIFNIPQAIKRVKELATAKFDEAIEVHIKLNLDQKSGVQVIRGTISFPKGLGKKRKIAAFVTPEKAAKAKKAGAQIVGGEELVQKIKNSKKVNFDIALAEPAMMRHLSGIAKLLGQKGLMPNPKTETVTPDIITAIREFKEGKMFFKSDERGTIHQAIGKVSFGDKDLIANFNTLISEIKKQTPDNQKGEFIESVVICSTMGPSLPARV